ncbi:MAG: AMP-dependent synthetase/ligase [Planctomycetota bacterium]
MPQSDLGVVRQMENVLDLLVRQATSAPGKPALTWWNEAAWQTTSWLELAADVTRLARGLSSVGVRSGDRVAILGENSRPWVLMDLALQACRAVSVPLHTQLAAEQIAEQLQHSGTSWMGVSTAQLFGKMESQLAALGLGVERVIPFEFELPGARSFEQLILSNAESGRSNTAAELKWLRAAARRIQPEDLLTVLYTSGTMGDPKGVMLTHRNIVVNARSKCASLPLGPNDRRICWLPLSHIFARVCDLVTGLLAGCQTMISRGRDHLFEECKQFQPTYLNGVPYFYERCYRLLQQQQRLSDPTALRALLGGEIQLCNCGGAPLADHVFDYFRSRGIGLVTGYGLTEAAPVVTSNRPDAWRRGSVGQAIPGVEVRLAADGEVLVRGENVMSGYYRNEAASQRAVIDGWLQTGDLGELDAEGYLFLNGRKDDLIVLNTAKKVYPGELESLLLASPLITQCCLFGNRRNYLVAILTVDHALLAQRAARAGAPEPRSAESGAVSREKSLLLAEVDRLLSGRGAHEQIGGVILTVEPFSLDNGLLTAKQSLRRKQIFQRYEMELEAAYRERATRRI